MMVPGRSVLSYCTAWRKYIGSIAIERFAQPARQVIPVTESPDIRVRRLNTDMPPLRFTCEKAPSTFSESEHSIGPPEGNCAATTCQGQVRSAAPEVRIAGE